MEQKEKIEKPAWVEIVESLPEASRQMVGNICAQCIQQLSVLDLVSTRLVNSIFAEVCKCSVREAADSLTETD